MDKDNLLKFQIARLKVDIKNVSNIYFPWHCNETHYTFRDGCKGADRTYQNYRKRFS